MKSIIARARTLAILAVVVCANANAGFSAKMTGVFYFQPPDQESRIVDANGKIWVLPAQSKPGFRELKDASPSAMQRQDYDNLYVRLEMDGSYTSDSGRRKEKINVSEEKYVKLADYLKWVEKKAQGPSEQPPLESAFFSLPATIRAH